MIRSIFVRVLASVVVFGLATGWTQTAQAQCQNGMCPSAVKNGSAVVTSANAIPTSNPVTVNANPTTVGQPVYYEHVNSCGFVTYSTVPPNNGCSSSCNSYPNVVNTSVQNSPVQSPTHYPTSSRCSGGTCNMR